MPIKSRIRTIPDHPKKGIMFRDITTLIKDPVGFRLVIDNFTQRYITGDIKFDPQSDVMNQIESRREKFKSKFQGIYDTKKTDMP